LWYIIQLFPKHTFSFCDLVLSAPLSPSQSVIPKLQQTLAFLRYSQRSIHSPSEFLKAARPPWFEAGRQQDCSEFLRHVLETLHEQEKTGRKGNVVVYGEHRLIESTPPSPPSREDSSEGVDSSSNGASSTANYNALSNQSLLSASTAKMRSAGSGLDVIVEEEPTENGGSPGPSEETVCKKGSAAIVTSDQDEVMSQVCCEQDSSALVWVSSLKTKFRVQPPG
jgi:hypothetical protein